MTRVGLLLGAACLVIASAAMVGSLVHGPASFAGLPAASADPTLPGDDVETTRSPNSPAREHGEILGREDGLLPDGVTAYDDAFPGVANLDPDLGAALREATLDAAAHGIQLYVNSGWRSPAYQEQLRREAVAEYGSEEQAARWVASVDTSAHVSGDAVDIGPDDAAAWLEDHGATYGLCRTYRNEPWHYELRVGAPTNGCPAMDSGPQARPPGPQQ